MKQEIENDNQQLLVSETFVSRQGEGRLTGTESFFIRTSGCNLRCWFCDTPYASWKPEGTRHSVVQVVEMATTSTGSERQRLKHVVLTGGEPLIASGVVQLARSLQDSGLHLTIETAGTVDVDVFPDLLSLSPKLHQSAPSPSEHPRWSRLHEERRMPLPTMRRLIDQAVDSQVKFVVDQDEEFDEIISVVDQLRVDESSVYIMPQATTNDQLDEQQRWLRPWAEANGFQYCDRMQIRWYGNRRGT